MSLDSDDISIFDQLEQKLIKAKNTLTAPPSKMFGELALFKTIESMIAK